MLTPAPTAVASPAKNAYRGVWVASATEKIGASEDSDPIDQAAQGGLRALQQERALGPRPR
jgi:hypothetical protein